MPVLPNRVGVFEEEIKKAGGTLITENTSLKYNL